MQNTKPLTNAIASQSNQPLLARAQIDPLSQGKKILVVEDGAEGLKQHSSLLETAGYEVARCCGSLAALFAVVRVQPDLVIVELRTPLMNGLALAHELKTIPEMRHIPVVVLGGHVTAKWGAAALKAGCEGYLSVFQSPDRFLEEIASQLRAAVSARPGTFVCG